MTLLEPPSRIGQAATLVLAKSPTPMAAARSVIGLAVLIRPALLARSQGIDAVTAERTTFIARSFAGRDLAIGVGALTGNRGFHWASVVADASDLIGMVAALRANALAPRAGTVTAVMSGAGALIGVAALLRSQRPAAPRGAAHSGV